MFTAHNFLFTENWVVCNVLMSLRPGRCQGLCIATLVKGYELSTSGRDDKINGWPVTCLLEGIANNTKEDLKGNKPKLWTKATILSSCQKERQRMGKKEKRQRNGESAWRVVLDGENDWLWMQSLHKLTDWLVWKKSHTILWNYMTS